MDHKIDFVIIWVVGNDKKWQEERKKYSENGGDGRNVRFRDWDNLKYWFRAVEKFAPWVNKIHFVTCGQVPSWLNTKNPKLNFVNHKDFIPKQYLPTFSSHPIELNLHRINNLSENFVYFNDDMFIISDVKPEDFFIDGKPCDSAILSPAIKENKNGIGNVELNNMAIINTYFNKNEQIKKAVKKWYSFNYEFKQSLKNLLLTPWNSFTSFYEFHVPSSFCKKTFETVWDKEFEELDETCKHRFRDLKLDVNQWVMRDWQLASNNFVPRKTKFGKLYTIDKDTNFNDIFRNKYPKMICLNDSENISDEEYDKLKGKLLDAFQMYLPEKSTFEI